MSRIHRIIATVAVCATGWAVPASAHAADDATYTVRAGDSIYGIAAKFDVRVSALTAANGLEITSVILPGQQLTIPGGGAAPAPTSSDPTRTGSSSGGSYTVVAGDSLYGIAARHGVSLASLLSVNGLTVSSLILPGMEMSLPASASTPTRSAAPTTTAGPTSSVSTSGGAHTVAAGDSLYGIARRHGVSLSSLLSVNAMSMTSLILPGMSLKLPAGASAPAQPAPAPAASTESGSSSSASSPIEQVVQYALAQQGKPYRFFTRGPSSFDCSGLTVAAYAQIGVDLVHYSAAQARQGRPVDFRNEPIQAGDLIFMKRRGSDTINHVGMAIDANRWIHAPGTGDVVRIGSMPAMSSIDTVRRYVDS